MLKNLKLRIGDISISLKGDGQKTDWEIGPAYRPFIRHGETDIALWLRRGAPKFPLGERVFECLPIWTLHRQNGKSAIKIFDSRSFPGLERILVMPRHFETAELYFADKSAFDMDPFHGPAMELLMVNYLAQGRGVILHACGVAMDGKGILFVGESGAGKSTLARMWDEGKGAEVLSDDRMIVRKKGEQFWMYGTPWHGNAGFASPQGAVLERVFFLKHGKENAITETKGIGPVSQFLRCSFPTYWDPQGMASALEIFTDLTVQVPCQELTFKPHRSLLDFVKRIFK